MKRLVGIAGGVVTGGFLYVVLAFGVLGPIQKASGRSPEAYLGVAFFLVMPVALFCGALLCGYVTRDLPRPKWVMAMIHSPGLYVFTISIPSLRGTISEFQSFMVAAGCVWIAASVPGVLLGGWLSRRRAALA